MLLNPRLKEAPMPTVSHPFLRDGVEARAYQLRALKNALTSSCLMVMPTGFGKTAVEWMIMAEFLRMHDKKILLIAPTTGLVEQQQRMAREMIEINDELIITYTGSTAPNKRAELWNSGKIIMATSQVIRNDVINKVISLNDVSLIIFDEAHHATGNHAYAQVGDLYLKSNPYAFTLGATASPGSTKSAILEVAKRLGIDRLDISKREDPLMQPYTVELNNEIIRIDLPEELKALIFPLQQHQSNEVESLTRMGFMAPVENLTSKVITDAQIAVSRAIDRKDTRGYNAARKVSDVRRMHMLLDLLKTQGVMSALSYLDKAEEDGRTGDRGTNRFVANPIINNFRKSAKSLGELHPKSKLVNDMVIEKLSENPDSRVLIFTEYRYTVRNLCKQLSGFERIKVSQFIGQSNSGKQKGMSQKQQLAKLSEFRSGEINVLVATSVGEEGLDVPSADLVLMYEPVPSAIRAIQRRGRTARQSSGTVKTLVTRNTRDEFVNKAAKIRESRMYKNLDEIIRDGRIPRRMPIETNALSSFKVRIEDGLIDSEKFIEQEIERLCSREIEIKKDIETVANDTELRTKIKCEVSPKDKRPSNQTGLDDFFSINKDRNMSNKKDEVKLLEATESVIDDFAQSTNLNVIVDHREASSTISAYLRSLGINVIFQSLAIGDFSLDNEILIERKTSRDLLSSIIDKRLFRQCERMRQAKIQPLLLIELGEIGNSVHPNAVIGALAHVTMDLGIPILTTKDSMESAYLIALIAKNRNNLSSKLREFIKYQNPNEETIEHFCQVAANEISMMINNEHESKTLLNRWDSHGKTRQAQLFSELTNIDIEQSIKLIDFYKSIAGIINSNKEELSKFLTANEIRKINEFFHS